MTKAVLNGDRIECGKCGALLGKFIHTPKGRGIPIEEWGVAAIEGWGHTLEIKCKHKDKGKCCNTINTIEL
jgi:hypothetical protein